MQQPTPDSVHCTGVPTVSGPFPCQLFICSVNLAPKLSVAHFCSVAMLYWWPEAQSAISLCHCMYWLVCSTIYKTATKLPGASQFACCQSSRFFVCFATGTATAATYAENRQKRRMKKMPNKYWVEQHCGRKVREIVRACRNYSSLFPLQTMNGRVKRAQGPGQKGSGCSCCS